MKRPFIKLPDTDALYPGYLGFSFTFKFRLNITAPSVTALLPGLYGPFVGLHKNHYYIHKDESDVLRLVVTSGFGFPNVDRFLTLKGDYAQTTLAKSFYATITPNTSYTVTYTKSTSYATTPDATVGLTVTGSTVTPTSQTIYGRYRKMMRTTNGASIFVGAYDAFHLFPTDLPSPVTLDVDDVSLSLQPLDKSGVTYRFRIDAYKDDAYAEAVNVTPTIAPPAPGPSPSPTPTPTPTPSPTPAPPPGFTYFALGPVGKYSQDGVTWSNLSNPSPSGKWLKLLKTSGYWVMCGQAVTAESNLAVSTNLSDWIVTNDPNLTTASSGNKLTYSDLAYNGTRLLMPSNIGGAFMSEDHGYSYGAAGVSPLQVAWYPAGSLFLGSGSGFIISSPTGLSGSWTTRSTSSGVWRRFAISGSTIVTPSSSTSFVNRSTNGTSWATVATTAAMDRIASDGAGTFVCMNSGNSNMIRSSDSGASWAAVTVGVTFQVAVNVVWTGSVFAALVFQTGTGYQLMTSPTGASGTWTVQSTLPTGTYTGFEVGTV